MKLIDPLRISEPRKHRYVELIEFSLKNPKFTTTQACTACGFSEKEFRFVASSIFELSAYQSGFPDPERELEWILKPQAYFSYLQYLEFCHAIETAKQAYWLSVAAVVIALISAAVVLR